MYTHKMVNGERVELTEQEIIALEQRDASFVAEVTLPPSKDELMAELATLTAKIQALE
jgi:hypothetical protein